MEYYYTPRTSITGSDLTIEGDEHTHLIRVMRKRPGDQVMVVDGEGTAYRAEIIAVETGLTRCAILSRHPAYHEPTTRLTLAVGLPKNPARFDLLVEKATELGVHAIIPLITERTIRRSAKTDRLRKIALAAMKQSGRSVLPALHTPVEFGGFLQSSKGNAAKYILHESERESSLSTVALQAAAEVTLAVGPEGGFTEREIIEAQSAGFTPAGLGERRLRTETAGIAAAAIILLQIPGL